MLGGEKVIGSLCREFRVHLHLRREHEIRSDDRQWSQEFRLLQSIARPRSSLPVALEVARSLGSPVCDRL